MGDRIENVGKPPCFNGFQVTLNMLKATFWIPAEPTWDSKVCAAPRSKGHFAVAVRCRPVSIRKPPGTGQRRVVLEFPTSGRAQIASLFFLLRRVFALVFRGSQGRSPRRFAGGLAATDSPDSPTDFPDEAAL